MAFSKKPYLNTGAGATPGGEWGYGEVRGLLMGLLRELPLEFRSRYEPCHVQTAVVEPLLFDNSS